MSATETLKNEKTSAAKVPTLAAQIGAALVELDQAMDNRRTAVAAVGFVRVKLGRLFSLKLQDLAKAEKTGETAQTAILALLGGRLDENDKAYDWKTVEGWITAAKTEDSLPEDLHHVFHVEGLRTIARVPAKAGKDEDGTELMVGFAKDVQKNGKTSARGIRAAFADRYPPKERNPKSPAMIAEDLRKTFADVAKTHRRTLERAGISWTVVRGIAVFAATVGQECPKDIEAVTIALNMLMDPAQDKPKATKPKATK